MCKFHKDVARDIATNSQTGEFHPGKFCIGLLAMAKFRIEQYMPDMHGCDGFQPSTMTTETAIEAFKASGLTTALDAVYTYRDENIEAMKAAMDLTTTSCDASLQGLNVPDNITKDGYKHCGKMPADITKAGPFMDEAVVQLFGGYDDEAKTFAAGDLHLVEEAHKPQFEAIRMATEHFLSQVGVTETLKTMFENSLVKVFEEARTLDVPSLETEGCVMCGHGSRGQAQTLDNV